MNPADEKQAVSKIIGALLAKEYVREQDEVVRGLTELKNDIENDFYTIVVLGEFKRGKSTFINALLHSDLLPVDVLPETATINALMYSEEPRLQVVYDDGTEKDGEVSNGFLKQFSASGNKADVERVKYIKIGYNSDILKKKLVIVDTPGVSDINEQRCEVTYRFIPKSNAVLFLLDATSPLKRTEKEFVEERLLSRGIDNILFIVNKCDGIDEEEDEDFMDDIERRLRGAFCREDAEYRMENVKVLPLSAKYALQGYLQNRPDLVECSGIDAVRKAVENTVYRGRVEEEKVRRYKIRLRDELLGLSRQLESRRALKAADMDKLREVRQNLDALMAEQEENRVNIGKYVQVEKGSILAMVDKSLSHFYCRFEEDIVDSINGYRGIDFKEFVETRISKQLKRGMENWVATYSPHIEHLLKKMERELANGISYRFNFKVSLQAAGGPALRGDTCLFNLTADDVSEATTRAGMIAAGGAGIMMLLGTPFLMPMISMAAFPMMQKKFLEERLVAAKAKVIPDVQRQMNTYMMDLKKGIHQHIDERCRIIVENTESAYGQILADMKRDVDAQIAEKERCSESLAGEVRTITGDLEELKQFMEML